MAENSSIAKLNELLATDRARLAVIAAAVNAGRAFELRGAPTLLGDTVLPCKISTLSQDSRGRAQKMVRFPDGTRTNFRPWHVAWIHAKQMPIPVGLRYSHRCNAENCIEPTHGRWETDAYNKSRWSCRTASHVLVPRPPAEGGYRCYRTCTHSPCCLVPKICFAEADHPLIEDEGVDLDRM